MSKTIEELAKQLTDELFAGDDLTDFDTQTEKNDAYVMCMVFGNHLMGQPLSVRLTAEEKERVRKEYGELLFYADFYKKKLSNPVDAVGTQFQSQNYQVYVAQIKLLECIFGADFFKERE